MSKSSSTSACLNAVKKSWEAAMKAQGHDWRTLQNLELVQARPNFLRARLRVEKEHLNKFKTMHGGLLLTLTDSITSLTLTTSGFPSSVPTGVSTNISTEFLRPVRMGGWVEMEGEVLKLGKQLSLTRVSFYSPSSDENPNEPVHGEGKAAGKGEGEVEGRVLLAVGNHTKAMSMAWDQAGGKLIRYSEDGESVVDPVQPEV